MTASRPFPSHFLLLPLLAIGCQKQVSTPFESDGSELEALEECSAGFPSGDNFPEQANSASGESDEWDYAHVCGYVHASIDDTWLALQDSDVVTDRRRVDEWEETESGHEPDFDVSFRVHHLVNDLVTVEYDIDWRQDLAEEAESGEVLSVIARFQKTEGSSLIELIEGSVFIDEVQDDSGGDPVVSVEVVYHHESLGYSTEDLQLKSEDLYYSIAAAARGEALPVWED